MTVVDAPVFDVVETAAAGGEAAAPRIMHVLAPPKPSDVLSVARIVAGRGLPVARLRLGNSTSLLDTLTHAGTI